MSCRQGQGLCYLLYKHRVSNSICPDQYKVQINKASKRFGFWAQFCGQLSEAQSSFTAQGHIRSQVGGKDKCSFPHYTSKPSGEHPTRAHGLFCHLCSPDCNLWFYMWKLFIKHIIYKYCAWCIFGCLCVLDQVGGWGFFVFSICIMCKQNSWVCFESPETISNVKSGFVSARQQQWVCSYWQTSGSPYSLGVWCQQLPARAFQVSRELPLVTLTCRECTAFHEPSTSLVWHLLSEEQGGVSIFLESNERKY